MPLNEKEQEKVRKAVGKYLDARDSFRAKRRQVAGEVNEEEKAALGAIEAQVAKLNITKDAFRKAITMEQHIRDARGVPGKVADEGDLDLAGGFASVLLATGSAFEPVLGEDGRAMQERAVYAAEADDELHPDKDEGGEGGGDDKVESLAGRRKKKTEEELAAAPALGVH